MVKSVDKKVEIGEISLTKNIIKDFFKKRPAWQKLKCLSKDSLVYQKLLNYMPRHYFEQTNGKILNGDYIDISLKQMGYKLKE